MANNNQIAEREHHKKHQNMSETISSLPRVADADFQMKDIRTADIAIRDSSKMAKLASSSRGMALSHRGSLLGQISQTENVYGDQGYSNVGMRKTTIVPAMNMSRVSSSERDLNQDEAPTVGGDSAQYASSASLSSSERDLNQDEAPTVGGDSSSVRFERVPSDQMMKLFTERQDKVREMDKAQKSKLQISFTNRDKTGNKYTRITLNKNRSHKRQKSTSMSPMSSKSSPGKKLKL
eukprot:CAMPEP_0185598950 /NCGR_PEP_ID=MMETSP0434-20130131/82347_1 /TAXON_ID=626734 ORGANISM="Favella taraikaensis, Strain Fe Narragansett Bay" /NCGR_SAMPLE_ID=MMETSP0434 /ASSEMBLY_ACC=CAM_ASM_000379 /LENGTH=235 /DNA_ID=CAMNT_0028228127 /DNA_START=239 /DNA_END=947 /DNA_ORIENTATION=-